MGVWKLVVAGRMGWFSCVDDVVGRRWGERATLYILTLLLFFCFDDDQNDLMTGISTPLGHFLDWERSGAGGPFWVFFFDGIDGIDGFFFVCVF